MGLWLIIVTYCCASPWKVRCIFVQLMFLCKCACLEEVLRLLKTAKSDI